MHCFPNTCCIFATEDNQFTNKNKEKDMAAGKWIGGILGFMTAGPLGALAGVVLGSLFDALANVSTTTDTQTGSYSTEQVYEGQRNSFLFSLLVLASYIIKADGKVMHSEMELVRNFLRTNFGESSVAQGEDILRKLFQEQDRANRTNPYSFKETIRQCCAQIAGNMGYSERLQLLNFLVMISQADGNVCTSEISALKEIAQYLGMSAQEVDSMLNLGGKSLDDAYKILEISPDATDDEVRSAYRKLALKHHPDRVATLGEDIRKAAQKKFQEITDARDRIYKARGL
jgi:DnaJ like chaperone protein